MRGLTTTIFKAALEAQDDPIIKTDQPQQAATVDEAKNQAPQTQQQATTAIQDQDVGEQKTVVMQGPLAALYSQALQISLAKPDPVTGLAAESQANDQITLVTALVNERAKKDAEIAGQDPETNNVTVYAYGTTEQDAKAPEVVAVIREIANISPEVPTNFVFYQDCSKRTSDSPAGSNEPSMLVLESIEIVVKTRPR